MSCSYLALHPREPNSCLSLTLLPRSFLSSTQVARGDATVECVDGGSEPVDFDTLFKLRLSDKLDNLFKNDRDLPTQFVLVPSLRDVFHEFVYPQVRRYMPLGLATVWVDLKIVFPPLCSTHICCSPLPFPIDCENPSFLPLSHHPVPSNDQPPFHDRVEGGVKLGVGDYAEENIFVLDIPKTGGDVSNKRVHLAPNPAWVRVNEVTIGVSSTDVLFDLSGEEISAGAPGGNRLARLAGHLLQQQSFYPLFPPPATSAAQLDMRHAHRWSLPSTPDVLLVPSKLAQFARDVQVSIA